MKIWEDSLHDYFSFHWKKIDIVAINYELWTTLNYNSEKKLITASQKNRELNFSPDAPDARWSSDHPTIVWLIYDFGINFEMS